MGDPIKREKSAERRGLAAFAKAATKRIAEMRAERLQPLRDLEKRQRLERRTLIQLARAGGLSAGDAAAAVKLYQRRQWRELQAQLQQVEHDRILAWRREHEAIAATLPWQPEWPLLAVVSHDERSLSHWANEVDRRSDEDFVSWL